MTAKSLHTSLSTMQEIGETSKSKNAQLSVLWGITSRI